MRGPSSQPRPAQSAGSGRAGTTRRARPAPARRSQPARSASKSRARYLLLRNQYTRVCFCYGYYCTRLAATLTAVLFKYHHAKHVCLLLNMYSVVFGWECLDNWDRVRKLKHCYIQVSKWKGFKDETQTCHYDTCSGACYIVYLYAVLSIV